MSNLTFRELLSRFRTGESGAAEAIFNRYVSRLLHLARGRLSPRLARRVDPEDIVQSAWRSFFVHARDGKYVLRRSGDLWRLLAAITLNKLHGQIEVHTAQKRDIRQEADVNDRQTSSVAASIVDVEPSPDEVAEVCEQVQRTMDELSSVERTVFELRLSGKTIEQIASAINRSQRTVRRILQQVKQTLESALT